jgi:hypothetical protein
MFRFTWILVAIASLILLVIALSSRLGATSPSYFVEILVLLVISTWVSVKKLVRIQSPSTFIQAYLASIVVKLIVWIGCLAVIFYLDRKGAAANALYFMINSLIMIGLEVYFLFTERAKLS